METGLLLFEKGNGPFVSSQHTGPPKSTFKALFDVTSLWGVLRVTSMSIMYMWLAKGFTNPFYIVFKE